jgi:hypothetical protein
MFAADSCLQSYYSVVMSVGLEFSKHGIKADILRISPGIWISLRSCRMISIACIMHLAAVFTHLSVPIDGLDTIQAGFQII